MSSSSVDSHIFFLRDQFPDFYVQFRAFSKAIGANGDGNLEYVYDNLMITEVPTFFLLLNISLIVERTLGEPVE